MLWLTHYNIITIITIVIIVIIFIIIIIIALLLLLSYKYNNISDGNVTFHLDGQGQGSEGSSLMSNSKSVIPHNNTITVKQIDVKRLFHHLLHLHDDDYVILKIDIEGAEFEVLRRIISHGMLHLIDILAAEWHDDNGWVFGDNEELKKKYNKQHECINWIVGDYPSINNIEWHRR